MSEVKRFEYNWAGRPLVIEIGEVAKQANGACLVKYGDSTVLSCAVSNNVASTADFFPLMVLYQEKLYAAGKIEHPYYRENESIHLGKRSGGWQFLWQFNDGKFYSDNLNSIKEFLNNPDYQIVDESGNVFTTEEFLNDEFGRCLYKTDDLWDLEHYWKVNPPAHDYMYSHLNDEWTSKDGLRFCKNYFS